MLSLKKIAMGFAIQFPMCVNFIDKPSHLRMIMRQWSSRSIRKFEFVSETLFYELKLLIRYK